LPKLYIFLKRKSQRILGFFPLYHRFSWFYLKVKNFRKHYRFVLKSQWFDQEKIRQYQRTHLKHILTYAYENVPYYKQLFDTHTISVDEIQSKEDLIKIPITNKELVKAHPDDFLSKEYKKFAHCVKKTSGSTGKPLEIFIDEELNSLVSALLWRHYNWAGCVFHSRRVEITYPLGFYKGVVDTQNLYEFDVTKKMLTINSALLNEKTLPTLCETIESFKPSHIFAYPSLMSLFAKYLARNPKFKIRPKSIILQAEKVYPEQRTFLEHIFGCPSFDFYGHWEFVVFAHECEYHNLHLNSELGITEIIKNGKVCAEREIGELVVTTLHNHSMPLIRYATGDYGYIREESCQCGRKMPVIEIVGSREKDLIVTKKGFFNVVSALPFLFDPQGNIKQIQFYQESKDHLIVRIVKGEGFLDSNIERMKNILSGYFLDSIGISFEFLEAIPRTKAGKYKYVDSKVPIEFS